MADGRPRIESDDLLIEILSRLPVRSLIQFRCVCKSWRALISDSHLVMEHLRRFKANGCGRRLLFSITPFQSIDIKALNDAVCQVSSSELSLPSSAGPLKIVGSCNGLICLLGNSGLVILWNPSTRDVRIVPVPLLPSFLGIRFYGFGYDSTIDDYKVVFGFKCKRNGTLATTVVIFTLKNGSWRTVAGPDVNLNGQGCLMNGALHWVEMKWAEEVMLRPVLSSRIMFFDLAEETFQELMPLSYLTGDQKYMSARIGNTRNCLFVYLCTDNAITVWLMKEYRVMESWTKVIQVPTESLYRPPRVGFLSFFNPICILENGEVLMNFDGMYLVLYNPNERTFRNVLEKTPAYLALEPAMYVESLVSPFKENI